MILAVLALSLLVQDAAAEAEAQSASPSVSPDASAPSMASHTRLLLSQVPAALEGWAPEGAQLPLAVQAFSMVGREDLVERFQPGSFSYPPCPVIEGEGFDAVIAAAREAQIVIINEAHNQPLHRRTIQSLGEALAGEFEIFAAETFNYLRLDQDAPGALGFYDVEPMFARELASLKEAGYRFAAYEIRAHQRGTGEQTRQARITRREQAQADNLIAEVFDADPAARVLVHVGYSHVLEAPQAWGEDQEPLRWFALRLKEQTGIDPLTISQTHCGLALEESDGAASQAATNTAVDGAPLQMIEPGSIWRVDPTGRAPDGGLDFAIAHAPLRFDDGRPAWRRSVGDVEVDIPAQLAPVEGAVLLEARAPGAPLGAVPIERLLVYPGDAHPLLLPPGEWVITAWTLDGLRGEASERVQ